jgi:CO dehydrogenase/acetyl-CoA synthase delta subunit
MSTSDKTRTPRWIRRELWEPLFAVLIGVGLVMLMQPWSIQVYGHSFSVLLLGVLGYSVAGKLPKE